MASTCYTTGMKNISDGTTIDFDGDTIKVMLVQASYTIDRDDDFVDEAGANDPVDHELSVTNYTGGFAGAGRKTLASKTITANKSGGTPANAVVFDAADITWTALGSGQTIESCILIKEVTNDAATSMICVLDVSQATNGGDITLQFHATDGIFKLNTA